MVLLWFVLAFADSPVVGGGPVEPGVWPSTAGVVKRDEVLCTAVIVHPRVALTAAHCAAGVDAVLVDTVDWSTGGRRVEVAKTVLYADWRSAYDVALLVLTEDAGVPSMPIARDCVLAENLQVGAWATVVGFGALDEQATTYGTVLHSAMVQVVDVDCEPDGALDCRPGVWPGGELVAGGDGVDACVGDSGGPLYLHTAQDPALVGLVARGVLPADEVCGEGGIYVRADALVDWVESEAGVVLTRPDCGNVAPTMVAGDVVVAVGDAVTVPITVSDTDGDAVTVRVASPASVGQAQVHSTSHGTSLHFVAGDVAGRGTLLLEATDDADYPRTTREVVDIDVRAAPDDEVPKGGCACSSSPGVGWWWLATFALARRYGSHSPSASSPNSEQVPPAVVSADS